jgi:hypothetical protein
MRRVLIVLSVLGSGTALSFGAAAAVLLANPNARMVPVNSSNGFNSNIGGGGKIIAVPGQAIPMPMPAVDVPADADGTGALPPDVVANLKVRAGALILVEDERIRPQSGTQP